MLRTRTGDDAGVGMRVHLLDGTYELFRHHFGVPSHVTAGGTEVAAVRGVLGSVAGMLSDGVTHLGVATDHVIESFRNEMWPGYKTGAGVPPELMGQFAPLEEALEAMGVRVWAMTDLEADDALASAARLAAADDRVEQVVICTPDKDLAQSVEGRRIVQFDRRQRTMRDEDGVRERFGVSPAAIPDYLALVGDSADGYPGLPGWGPKSAATVLARYGRLEDIPDDHRTWTVPVRGAATLAATLVRGREVVLLFRELARLRDDAPLFSSVDELAWAGPRPDFAGVCGGLEMPELAERVAGLAAARS